MTDIVTALRARATSERITADRAYAEYRTVEDRPGGVGLHPVLSRAVCAAARSDALYSFAREIEADPTAFTMVKP
jgi:hypothetical protein